MVDFDLWISKTAASCIDKLSICFRSCCNEVFSSTNCVSNLSISQVFSLSRKLRCDFDILRWPFRFRMDTHSRGVFAQSAQSMFIDIFVHNRWTQPSTAICTGKAWRLKAKQSSPFEGNEHVPYRALFGHEGFVDFNYVDICVRTKENQRNRLTKCRKHGNRSSIRWPPVEEKLRVQNKKKPCPLY